MVGFYVLFSLVLAVLAYGLFVKKVNIIKLVVPSYIAVFYVLCGNSRDFVVGR